MTYIITFGLLVVALLAFLSWRVREHDSFFNVIILGLTAVILLVNTYVFDRETTRTLQQNWKVNLRPVILPSIIWPGSPDDYYQQQFKNGSGTIWFNTYDHVATNIRGYIVANHQQTKLDFAVGSILTVDRFNCNTDPRSGGVTPWIAPTRGLCGYFDFKKNSTTSTSTNNEIYLQYEDIDGHPYFTKAIDSSISLGGLSGD